MAANLPSGLVANSSEIADDIRAVGVLSLEDIKKLWKAYHINKRLLPNDAGFRLEQLFWRIWSSPRLQSTVNGVILSRLFDEICEGRGFRTTPVPSPRTSHLVDLSAAPPQAQEPDEHKQISAEPFAPDSSQSSSDVFSSGSEQSESQQPPPALMSQESSSMGDDNEKLGVVSQSRRGSRADSTSVQFSLPTESSSIPPKVPSQPSRLKDPPPQSILKKPRQSSQPESTSDLSEIKEERTATDDIFGDDPSVSGGSTVSDMSPTSATIRKPVSPKIGSPGVGSNNGGRRKRTSFVIGSNSRKRPSFTRRKSSQSSASGSIAKSHSSVSDVSASSVTPKPSLSTTPTKDTLVVDKDFRSNFMREQRPGDRFTLLRRQSNPKTPSTVASTSAAGVGTVAIADAAADVKGKGKARAPPDLDADTLNDPLVASILPPAEQLPRTKSQLTLLLERDDRRSSSSRKDPLA